MEEKLYTEHSTEVEVGEDIESHVQMHALRRHFPSAQIYLNGNNGNLYGCSEDDANSLDYLLDQLEHQQPEALILGGMAASDLDYYRLSSYKYYGDVSSLFKQVTPGSIIARKRMNHYFEQELSTSPAVHSFTDNFQQTLGGDEHGQEDYRLFELNHRLKRKIWLTQLTAARL